MGDQLISMLGEEEEEESRVSQGKSPDVSLSMLTFQVLITFIFPIMAVFQIRPGLGVKT